MKILNLYSGLGGNRKKWENVDVTAVESSKKIADIYINQFPEDQVIIGDAHDYLLKNYDKFDFIWSSPPCQSHSRMMKATRHNIRKYPDMNLYQEIIFLQHFFKRKWIVENVKPYYDPLIKPTSINGRHFIWSNFNIPELHIPSPKNFINSTNSKGAEALKEWLGINYEGNVYYEGNHCPAQVLRNCVHPDLGLHILESSKAFRFRRS